MDKLLPGTCGYEDLQTYIAPTSFGCQACRCLPDGRGVSLLRIALSQGCCVQDQHVFGSRSITVLASSGRSMLSDIVQGGSWRTHCTKANVGKTSPWRNRISRTSKIAFLMMRLPSTRRAAFVHLEIPLSFAAEAMPSETQAYHRGRAACTGATRLGQIKWHREN